uniref:Protein yippee-like n=1 Tax=Chenopodium quinoa TaxID=63459 RepID=A0A803LLK7_CHEQI
MGRVFLVELDGKAYRCRCCNTPLALAEDVLSRSFSCRQGRAYLFENAVNVTVGPEEDRLMMSGMHTVADVFCCGCGQLLGWKYMLAREKSQKWRITEDSGEEFNLDARQNSSESEYP